MYVQAQHGQSAKGRVVYVQQPQQAPETKQNKESGSNDKNKKKSKGFMSKVFGNSPKHIMKETEAVIGKNSTDSIKKGSKDAYNNLYKEMANAGNQFNKEINAGFNSLFGAKKKKQQPQQQRTKLVQPHVVYAQQPQVVYVQPPQQMQHGQ
eukprot:UN11223